MTDLAAARAELLELLLRGGILHATPAQPIFDRDGVTTATWMLDSLSVSLTPRGGELAGRVLLDLLDRFEGRQVATYGLTAVPLLQACVLQSGGRWRGLLVRKERKVHGARKLIEGPLDPAEPVVILDDSISSGLNMTECVDKLEAAGLRVEGAACLVRFGWDRGYALLRERGLHLEAAYDIFDDLMAAMPAEPKVPANISKEAIPEIVWAAERAPDGIDPAALARLVMAAFLEGRPVPRPPARLGGDRDAAGGAWVSVRSRAERWLRHARDGFWHFPEDRAPAGPAAAAEDVARAAAKTAAALQAKAGSAGAALELLSTSAVAATLFSALEPCAPGELDNERYGIVVRSRERRPWVGGALPRMPGIGNEWQQLEHARKNNARLTACEPFELFRHEVDKAVEPGESWPKSGAPLDAAGDGWLEDPARAGAVARRAREIAAEVLRARAIGGAPAAAVAAPGAPGATARPAELVPAGADLDSVYVTIYSGGRTRGCVGARVRRGSLEADLRPIVEGALDDRRFPDPLGARDARDVAVSASILTDPSEIGTVPPDEVQPYFRFGDEALLVWQGERCGILLPSVATTANLGPVAFAHEVVDKAGITRPPYHWARFRCTSYLSTEKGLAKLDGGLPAGPPPTSLAEARGRLAPLLAGYLVRHLRADGGAPESYAPFSDAEYGDLDLPRLGHTAWILARAGAALGDDRLVEAARRAVDRVLAATPEPAPSIADTALPLLAVCALPDGDPRRARAPTFAEAIEGAIDVHGRFRTHSDEPGAPPGTYEAFQDYYPAEALLALARACTAGVRPPDRPRLERAFRYYRHRFRFRRHWGQVCWLPQACRALHALTGEREAANLAFEVAEFALEHQSRKHGGFLNDHQWDTPGFTSALYLEALGAARALAAALGDGARSARYDDALLRGLAFLDRLVLQDRDRPLLPAPDRALGGVRPSLHQCEVRLDFVAHALAAVIGARGD